MKESLYAFLVDNEVFNILDASHTPDVIAHDFKRGFNNNPIGMDITDYPNVEIGSKWLGDSFDKNSTLPGQSLDKNKYRKYCFLADNTVFGVFAVENTSPKAKIWEHAFQSHVTAVDITGRHDIEHGYIWTGTDFIAPSQTYSSIKTITSAWQQWKNNLGDTRPWHVLNPSEKRVSAEIAQERFAICLGCSKLSKLTQMCKKCGCVMKLKTKLESSVCPLGHW